MAHTHEYKFWHAHRHSHGQDYDVQLAAVGMKGIESNIHYTGHYHIFAQTHEHGLTRPHSHKEHQYHPQPSDIIHHHNLEDHNGSK